MRFLQDLFGCGVRGGEDGGGGQGGGRGGTWAAGDRETYCRRPYTATGRLDDHALDWVPALWGKFGEFFHRRASWWGRERDHEGGYNGRYILQD